MTKRTCILVWPGDQDGDLGAVHMCCYVNTTHVVEDCTRAFPLTVHRKMRTSNPTQRFDYSCDSLYFEPVRVVKVVRVVCVFSLRVVAVCQKGH